MNAIEFRNSSPGRQAYLQGRSLAVWDVMMLARSYGNNAAAVAKYLNWSEAEVQAAFNYAETHPDEIEAAIADNDAMDFEALSRLLPQAAEFIVK